MAKKIMETVDVDLKDIYCRESIIDNREIGDDKEADTDDGNLKMALETLASSIAKNGLFNPILITRAKNSAVAHEYDFEVVAGHRRYLAFQKLNNGEFLEEEYKGTFNKIPCIIKERLNETDAIYISLSENLSRLDMAESEKAKKVNDLYQKLKASNPSLGYGTIAKPLGISRQYVKKLVEMVTKPKMPVAEKNVNVFIEKYDINELEKVTKKAANRLKVIPTIYEIKDQKKLAEFRKENLETVNDLKKMISYFELVNEKIKLDIKEIKTDEREVKRLKKEAKEFEKQQTQEVAQGKLVNDPNVFDKVLESEE